MTTLRISETVTRLTREMDKVIIGYADIKRYSIAAMLSDQHVLLEGLPETASRSLSKCSCARSPTLRAFVCR